MEPYVERTLDVKIKLGLFNSGYHFDAQPHGVASNPDLLWMWMQVKRLADEQINILVNSKQTVNGN